MLNLHESDEVSRVHVAAIQYLRILLQNKDQILQKCVATLQVKDEVRLAGAFPLDDDQVQVVCLRVIEECDDLVDLGIYYSFARRRVVNLQKVQSRFRCNNHLAIASHSVRVCRLL